MIPREGQRIGEFYIEVAEYSRHLGNKLLPEPHYGIWAIHDDGTEIFIGVPYKQADKPELEWLKLLREEYERCKPHIGKEF